LLIATKEIQNHYHGDTMYQIKVFNVERALSIEGEVGSWLSSHPNIVIDQVSQSSTLVGDTYRYVIIVIYHVVR
jgi:hypothetical protein